MGAAFQWVRGVLDEEGEMSQGGGNKVIGVLVFIGIIIAINVVSAVLDLGFWIY